jgi:hypothetical protein
MMGVVTPIAIETMYDLDGGLMKLETMPGGGRATGIVARLFGSMLLMSMLGAPSRMSKLFYAEL